MFLSALRALAGRLRSIEGRAQKIQEALGRIEGRQLENLSFDEIQKAEFRVFSQWGEDGILHHIFRHIQVSRKIFVEFGVENYTESNTRYLLTNDNWSGLVIDGSAVNIEFIKKDDIYWKHNLKADSAFITRENINQLIERNGITGDIGLLSIDIDGNDYWVWEAIDVVTPTVVIAEYNSRFGSERAVTTPYDASFFRTKAHHSNIYYGASLTALYLLGKRNGYSFVGCNSAGNNAFFVKDEMKPRALKELTPSLGFVRSQFRESRNIDGSLAFLTDAEEEAILDQLPLVEVR